MPKPAIAIHPGKQKLYEQIVDTLTSIFGYHPGYRTVHAKGLMCEGAFVPAPSAASISRAPHFQRDTVPVTVRFSDSAGIPAVRDGDPGASPRGFGIKFHLPDGTDTDIVAHSFNGFPVATAEEFLAFAKARASSGPNRPKPTELETFLARHTQARLFVEARKPTPASFATESYYGVNAFRFINRDGVARFGRYRIHPVEGERYLEAAVADKQSANFLFDELASRLSRGPASFRLFVQLAGDTDRIADPSIAWPDDRPRVEMGTLAIAKTVADSETAQRRLIFDPARLTDGIELSDDPLPLARSAVYAISYDRRNR